MGSKPSKSKKSSGKHSTDGFGSDPENSATRDKRFKKQSKKSSGGSSDHPTMPLFGHKQSEAGKKKQQDKVFLAQQSPEATVDVSECDATEVPHGIFGICKLLRKEALLLHTNWLTSLKGGGSILDLISIRVLDLHSNELASLPDDICMLINLQVLNLERNKLSRLPADIGNLRSLQNLNFRANRLKVLPDSMTKLKSLRSLDITDNHIVHLPRELCQVRTLETLQVDTPSMVYPDSETCSQGTEAMMRKLCSDCNIDYIPPSTFLLDILEPPKVNSPTMSENPFKGVAEDVEHMASFAQYAEQQEKKRLEQLEVQREFENQRTQQAQQASVWAADKQDLVKVLAAGEAKVFEELNYLTERKERERVELVASIHEVELQAADLMNQLLKVNEKAKKTEEIMEQMERERMEQEEWFLVRQEESDNLRKQEVLVAMERLMADNKNFEKLWDMYLADKADYSLRASHSEAETNDQINSVLQLKQKEQDALFDILCQQEKLQKEAFEALQLQKDMKHMRLTSEISLIQEELIKLSRVELDRNDQRQETTMNILKEKRLALTGMMMQLIDERENRAIELKRRTREMEQRKLDGQIDYWLVQYQRLMDRKPQELIDQENLLEIAVLKILEQAGAGDYIPLFSRHRITIETMVTLSDADIKQMGVHEMGLRRSILRKVDDYKEKEGAAEKKTFKPDARLPSAPSHKDVEAPSPDLKARGVDSECCICMERKSSVIFLACGHVCTCEICSPTVTECPLCRCEIHQRIALIA